MGAAAGVPRKTIASWRRESKASISGPHFLSKQRRSIGSVIDVFKKEKSRSSIGSFGPARVLVDSPGAPSTAPEEDAELGPALRGKGIAPIRLATPTTDAQRLPQVLEGLAGFLYYVSVAGITGKQQAAQTSIEEAVARLKAATGSPMPRPVRMGESI